MSDDKTPWNIELDEQLLQDLYAWIDQVPLSRSKRRIERDFSDGGTRQKQAFILIFKLFYFLKLI
jgi:hypothetical protein